MAERSGWLRGVDGYAEWMAGLAIGLVTGLVIGLVGGWVGW